MLSAGEIVALAFGITALVLFIAYAWLAWRSWRKLGNLNPYQTRVKIDPQEYQGKWYEIARYDQWFERGCTRATAEYTPQEDGTIKVVNRCQRKPGERWRQSTGVAKPTKHDGVLGVSFFPGIWGNYTVVKRSPKLSVVSNPARSSLWVLYRQQSMPHKEWKNTLQWLRQNGYDTKKLFISESQSSLSPAKA